MNALAALLALVATGLAALVFIEIQDQPPSVEPAVAPSPIATTAPAAPRAAADADPSRSVEILLARPLFSQTRRAPSVTSPAAPIASTATPLPRMTGILIDGARRSAIFAPPATSGGGKPVIVAEGGHIGPFTVQTIEPQQVIVIGPEGKRTVRTSFDPTLQPPAPPQPFALGAPQFPGIAPVGASGVGIPGGPPLSIPPIAPGAGYGIPQPAGAAR